MTPREQIAHYRDLQAPEDAANEKNSLTDRFSSRTAFVSAVPNEKRRTLTALGWQEVKIVADGKPYTILLQDGLSAIQSTVGSAEAIWWAADDVSCSPGHSETSGGTSVGGVDGGGAARVGRQADPSKQYGPHETAFTGVLNGRIYKYQLADM